MVLAALGGAGCMNAPTDPNLNSKPFRVEDLAKTDIDQVAELHLQATRDELAKLMRKLYRRNPTQWRRAGKPSAEFAVQRVFRPARVPDFVELEGRRGVKAIRLAFDESYRGDRVLAYVAGLMAMVDSAYGNKRKFFVLDELDAQKLYNCARNLETAAWLLRSTRNANGEPYLYSYSPYPGAGEATVDTKAALENLNLSFERLFGKLISQQDLIAQIIANRSNRTIRTVVHRVVGAVVFLPI